MVPAPTGITLLHGDESHLVDQAARAWLAAARASAGDLDVEVIDQPSRLDPVRRSLSEVPLFDPQRFVLIRDAPQLSERGRRGADSPDALVAALHACAPTTAVCMVAHLTVSSAHPVVRALGELHATIRVHPALRGRDLRLWAERRLREVGVQLPAGGIEHLLTVTGGDLGVLDGEIAKLRAYAGDHPLSLDALQRLVAGDESLAVWAVVERLLGRTPARGAVAVSQLLDDGVSSQYLLSTLAGQLREVLQAQDALRQRGGGAATLVRELRLPSWRADRLARQAGVVSEMVVEEWLRELQRLDVAIKAGEASDTDGLLTFALRAARAATWA